jgi:hypothetical protein
LVLPRQNKSEDSHDAMALAAEQGMFDPWVALADHRPLGNVMRARKGVYHQSQQGRATTHQPLRSS